MSKTESNHGQASEQNSETTNLEFGKDAPDEADPCEHSTHMGSPVVVTAVGNAADPVREVKVCSACQTVLDDGKWEDASGVVIEGEGKTLMRRTNVDQNDEQKIELPLGDVLDRDPDRVQVNHAGILDGNLYLKVEQDPQASLGGTGE